MLFIKLTVLLDLITAFLIFVYRIYFRTLDPLKRLMLYKNPNNFGIFVGLMYFLAMVFTFIAVFVGLLIFMF